MPWMNKTRAKSSPPSSGIGFRMPQKSSRASGRRMAYGAGNEGSKPQEFEETRMQAALRVFDEAVRDTSDVVTVPAIVMEYLAYLQGRVDAGTFAADNLRNI